jgi:hypothetical protein
MEQRGCPSPSLKPIVIARRMAPKQSGTNPGLLRSARNDAAATRCRIEDALVWRGTRRRLFTLTTTTIASQIPPPARTGP